MLFEQVFPNLYSVHNDPNVWTEPGRYNPDRFLDSSGRVYGRERTMPFGVGELQSQSFSVSGGSRGAIGGHGPPNDGQNFFTLSILIIDRLYDE